MQKVATAIKYHGEPDPLNAHKGMPAYCLGSRSVACLRADVDYVLDGGLGGYDPGPRRFQKLRSSVWTLEQVFRTALYTLDRLKNGIPQISASQNFGNLVHAVSLYSVHMLGTFGPHFSQTGSISL
jgi:hypothetical protein